MPRLAVLPDRGSAGPTGGLPRGWAVHQVSYRCRALAKALRDHSGLPRLHLPAPGDALPATAGVVATVPSGVRGHRHAPLRQTQCRGSPHPRDRVGAHRGPSRAGPPGPNAFPRAPRLSGQAAPGWVSTHSPATPRSRHQIMYISDLFTQSFKPYQIYIPRAKNINGDVRRVE